LVEWIAWAEPQYDFNPMIDEWCKEAPKELDFNHEAGNSPCSVSYPYASLDNFPYSLPPSLEVIVSWLMKRSS
jgi:hypothetical protein